MESYSSETIVKTDRQIRKQANKKSKYKNAWFFLSVYLPTYLKMKTKTEIHIAKIVKFFISDFYPKFGMLKRSKCIYVHKFASYIMEYSGYLYKHNGVLIQS